jgi:hypothetical protein
VFAKSDNGTPSSMHAAKLLCLLCSKRFSFLHILLYRFPLVLGLSSVYFLRMYAAL